MAVRCLFSICKIQIYKLKRDRFRRKTGHSKERSPFFEEFRRIGGQEPRFSIFCKAAFHFRVAPKIVYRFLGNNIPLEHQLHLFGEGRADSPLQKRIMGTGQQKRINFRILAQKGIDVLFHKELCPFRVPFAVFDQRHPHGAGMLRHLKIGKEMLDFNQVTARRNRSRRTENAYMARLAELADFFGGGPHNAKHALVREFVREHVLLNATECLGRSRITGQNHQGTATAEKFAHGLQGIAENSFKAAGALGGPSVITQVKVVVLRKNLLQVL